MTEQILAYGAQNSYAQSEGAFAMPDPKPPESQRPHVEGAKRESHAASGRTESQYKPESSLFKPLNRPENERPWIPFSVAEPAITIINQIQNEKDVVASADDLAKIRVINEQFGDLDEAKKLKKPEEVIVYAQEVLRNSRIEEPTAEELHYAEGSPHAEGLKAVLRRQIAQAQGRNMEKGTEDEEVLTKAKVHKHLTVDDEGFGSVAAEGGPGAMPAGALPNQMTFKQLLQEKLNNLGQPLVGRLLVVENEILTRVHSSDPEIINKSLRDLRELRFSREHNGVLLAQVDQVLPGPLQNELAQAKEALDAKYTYLIYDPVNGLTEGGRRALLKDLDDYSQGILSNLRWGQTRDINAIIDELGDKAENGKVTYPEPPGLEGLRNWYAVKLSEDIRNAYEIIQRGEVKANPFENIRSAEEIMRFFEKSKSVEGFNLARDRLTRLLDAVENSTDPDLTEDNKFEMRKHIESFEVISPIFITMYQQESDPEAMARAVNPIENDTWFNWYDRFSNVRDKDGNPYMQLFDAHGSPVLDANGDPVIANLLSETVRAFKARYQEDNYRKKQVQEMTKRDLNLNTVNSDEEWLIKNLLHLPQNQPLPHLTFPQVRQLRQLWNDDEAKRRVVQGWYTERTLIGVDGFASNSSRELRDVREDELMDTTLRNRLVGLGVPQARVDALLENYELTQAVKANAANFVRFTLASTLDRVRIYSQESDRDEYGGKKLVASLFGEETPFYAREMDQAPDFFFSEGHGDANVNKLIRRSVDERWRGWMLASNNLIYREINQLKDKRLLPGDMADRIEQEVQLELGRVRRAYDLPNLQRQEVEAYVIVDMIDRYNPTVPLDPTTIDLSTIDFAEASKELDSYTFKDNASDRLQTEKWYRGKFKAFTFQPFDKELFEMLDEYYSSRHIRKRQAMDFFLDITFEAGKHYKEWLDYKDNMTDVQMEAIIQTGIEHNVLDKTRAEKKKNELLGSQPGRLTKQSATFLYEALKDYLRPGSISGALWDFFKTLFAYLAQQKY